MGRPWRLTPANVVSHVLNRANAPDVVRGRGGDDAAYERVLAQARKEDRLQEVARSDL